MSILSFNSSVTGLVGNQVNPRRVTIVATDNLATVTAAGYLNNLAKVYSLLPTDIIDMWYSYVSASNTGTFGMFTLSFTESSGNQSIQMVEWSNPGDVLLPVVSGDVPEFNGTSGQIKDSNIAASSLIVNSNNSGQTIAASTSSATPGTIRALIASMTQSATTMTSGNIVGLRGVVNMVGSSTSAYVYGVQGKIIATGTLASGQFQAGVFGQVDISAATINGGQLAPIWGDYGAASGTLTSQVGLYGLAMTNTTAAVLEGQIYLYGGATNLLYLNTNAGESGTTYFKAAGTGSSSWGASSWAAAPDVLQISVNGTTYYIPVKSSNS